MNTCDLSEGKKWMIILVVGLLFFIVAAPFTFNFTSQIFNKLGWKLVVNGAPTYTGIVIHAIVFMLLLRLLMFIKF